MNIAEPPVAEAPPDPSPGFPDHSPRRGLVKLLIFLSVVVLLFGVGGLYVRSAVAGSAGPSKPVTIVVPKGASVSEIATLLAKHHVIRNAWLFRIIAAFDGRASKLKPGDYQLHTGMSFSAVLAALSKTHVIVQEHFTVPEGKTVREVIDIIGRKTSLSAAKFKAEVTSGRYRLSIMPPGISTLEGLLFPKTYAVKVGMTEGQVVQMMLDQFTEETTSLDFSKGKGLSAYQLVVMASLIEREAKTSADRGKIAGVIYNRIARKMKLQIDATVQYAIYAKTGQYKPRLTYADYGISSPFNTYQIQGLPPSPIANPGLASLEAAVNPAATDALYYVLCDKQGGHAFAKSAAEFEKLKHSCAATR
ncbi:MAG: endolytic transglycosylase MltG [Actinomycetota bacterium]